MSQACEVNMKECIMARTKLILFFELQSMFAILVELHITVPSKRCLRMLAKAE